MTATTAASQRAFDPDHYLDCRQPGWEVYEDRGLVRFERVLGQTPGFLHGDLDALLGIHAHSLTTVR